MSDAITFPREWEGNEQGAATLAADLRDVDRALRKLESSISANSASAGHFLNVIQFDWIGGDNAAAKGDAVEGQFRKAAGAALTSIAESAKQFRTMAALAKGVANQVDEKAAQLAANPRA